MVAENNSVCRSFGSFATMLRMSWMKPMSSMRSASSSTSTSTWLSRTPFARMRSSRRPGVATSTSRPFIRSRTWRPIGTPPMTSATRMPHVAAVGAEALEDLAGELARRARAPARAALLLERLPVGGEPVEDRQRERGGLAGAGLRDADEVAAGEDQRDGVGLDRGGGDVLLFSKGAGDRLCEAEVVKGGQMGSPCGEMRPHDRNRATACRGVCRDTPPDLGCQCDGMSKSGPKPLFWLSYRRPRRRPDQRADAAYMAVLLEFFKAGVSAKEYAGISKLSTTC